jgi:hypothetical protein
MNCGVQGAEEQEVAWNSDPEPWDRRAPRHRRRAREVRKLRRALGAAGRPGDRLDALLLP